MTAHSVTTLLERVLANPASQLSDAGIGFVGPDVPIEVLLAAQRPFGHLPWRTQTATPFANSMLETSFPFWARSILEQWHDGEFDGLSVAVFSRADDASQRLYYYVAELQRRGLLRGPRTVMFDIALVARQRSLEHTTNAINALCRELTVAPERLVDATDQANALRAKLTALDAGRRCDGPLFERIARAALWSDPTRWIDQISVAHTSNAHMRVLLAGSVPPDDRIHTAIEDAGAVVVAELHPYGLCRLGSKVVAGDRAIELALAAHLRTSSLSPRAWLNRAQRTLERAREVGAGAVVIWLTAEDEALAWQVPTQRRLLEEYGMPVCILSASDWRFDASQRNRLTEFMQERIHAAS